MAFDDEKVVNPDANAARHELSGHEVPSTPVQPYNNYEERFNDPELFNEHNNGDIGYLAYIPMPDLDIGDGTD